MSTNPEKQLNQQQFYDLKLRTERQQVDEWIKEFEALERGFVETEAELAKNEKFSRFATEFSKLCRSLVGMKGIVLTHFKSFEELVNEYLSHFEQTIDQSRVDQDNQTLKTLKQQIVRAEGLLQVSNKREESAKAEARQIRNEINNLTNTIKQGIGLSAAQERTISDLIATKEQSMKEVESELEKIVSLRSGLSNITERIEKCEVEKHELENEIQSLKDRNTAKKIEIDNETRNKEKLEQELREQRVIVTIKSHEVIGKQDAVNRATEDIAIIEGQIRQQKQMLEKLLRDQENIGTRAIKLQQDYDEQMTETSKLMTENESAMAALRLKEDELLNHKGEVRKVQKMKELLIKKNRMLEDQKLQAELVRKDIRATNDSLLGQIEKRKSEIELTKKIIEDMSRERDILKADLSKTQIESTRIASLLALQRQQKSNMELEMSRVRRESLEKTKELKAYEKEKEEAFSEVQKMGQVAHNIMTELKQKEVTIFENKKLMFQTENKLKHQQNLYEGVQSERNLFAKQLIESNAEIAEMKRKLKIMNFQISGYKDDIYSKEAMLSREASENSKLTKDIALIEDDIKELKNQNQLAQVYIRSQLTEEAKLDSFVKDAALEKSRQENALNLIINERDHLSSQLLRRNEELANLYAKIKTQRSSLLRGEVYYKDKLKQITELRKENHEKKVNRAKILEETSGIASMKQKIIDLKNQIMQEEVRIKALEEELENPINVHRWRKLEGSNPQAFEMLQSLHSLQKQLIAKVREEREKQEAIEIKEKLYLHLKAMLAKQVGPEAIEQMNEFVKTLKEKKLQLGHMDTELNMYQAQVREYNYSISKLDQELADMKQKFLKLYHKKVVDYRNKEKNGEKSKTEILNALVEREEADSRGRESTTHSLGNASIEVED